MHPAFPYRIKGQQLWLSADRSIFWEEERSLIVSDLHFGKTGHFRKSGIGVPQSVYREDLQRLLAQLQYFQPRQLLVVGDLVLRLIRGNHDILQEEWYRDAGIEVIPEQLEIGSFLFVHDIETVVGSQDVTQESGE